MYAAKPYILRVMTFDIWVGGEAGGQPLAQTEKIIRAAQADIVGVQESEGKKRDGKRSDNARRIADQLGWNYFSQQDDDTGIMTRYTIIDHTPKKWGVAVELPAGKRVWMFNAHFNSLPYQPYQLIQIPYHDSPFLKTAAEAVTAARNARQKQVESMLAEVVAVRDQDTAIFITGDFNEPSSLDWTEPVFRAGPLHVRCTLANNSRHI